MADEDYEIDGKPLSDLRVVDLKQELDKRGLSKIGSKKELTERLKTQIRLEDQEQRTQSVEGCVPNLARQDHAIDEQCDIVKEYLAQQKKILDPQKEARQRRELEKESEEAVNKDNPDNSTDSKQDTFATPVEEDSRKGGVVEPMKITEKSTQLAKENSKSQEELEKTTADAAVSKDDKKSSREASEDGGGDNGTEKCGDNTKGKVYRSKPDEEILPGESPATVDPISSSSESKGSNCAATEGGPKQVSRRGSRGSIEESSNNDGKEARSTRPRIRREFFLPEPEKETSRDGTELNSGGSTRRTRNEGKDESSKPSQEKQSSSEKGQGEVKNKLPRNVSDATDSSSKNSPLHSTGRRSSDVKKRRGSSSSSSRSSSSSSSKHSRSRSGSSRGSSKHGSRSSSSSSSHSSKSQDGRRSRSKSESPRAPRKESENSLQQKKRERSRSPQRSLKKRQRSGDSSANQKKTEIKPAAIMDDNTEDVITTLAEEEIDSKLDVDVLGGSEVGRKQSGKSLAKDDMEVDEKMERKHARDAEKKTQSLCVTVRSPSG